MPGQASQLARPSRNPGAGTRARAELARDPGRSDRLIAIRARCDPRTVRRARRALEASGALPHGSQQLQRVQRTPPPRAPGRARQAIATLGPSATPAAVASAAGVSRQAAHAALQRHRAWTEAQRAPHPPPPIRRLPPQPDLSGAACSTGQYLPVLSWTASDRTSQLAARAVCRSLCPQVLACREWALATGAGTVDGILGGLTPAERAEVRRQRKRQAASAGLSWP